jgi:hypothetical protein
MLRTAVDPILPMAMVWWIAGFFVPEDLERSPAAFVGRKKSTKKAEHDPSSSDLDKKIKVVVSVPFRVYLSN